VLGTYERSAVDAGAALTKATCQLLDDLASTNDLVADVVFADQDAFHASQNKSKIGITHLREERPRLLEEIINARPDFIMCFGPVAAAAIFDHGSMTEEMLWRKAHYPLRDLAAAVAGNFDTEWGEYTTFHPHDLPAPHWPISTVSPRHPAVIGFDLETYPGTSEWAKNARIRMAVFSSEVGFADIYQLPSDSKIPYWLKTDILENPDIIKTGSNIGFDVRWMRRFGVEVRNYADTGTREHIIDCTNPKTDLKSLAGKYVPKLGDYARDQRALVKERGGWENLEDHEMYQYAGGDGEASIGIYLGQEKVIREKKLERPIRLFNELYPGLVDMEYDGCRIDLSENRRLDTLYTQKMWTVSKRMIEVLGPINPNSPPQLQKALLKTVPKINLTRKEIEHILGDEESDELTTCREVLEREAHKHPVIGDILEYRKYHSRHKTFIKGIHDKHMVEHDGGWYIHPSFRTDVTETYRLASRRPNGMNMPKVDVDSSLSIKRQFVSRFPGGKILDVDAKQLEIIFAAWLSQDPRMVAAVTEGQDIHRSMAAQMLGKPEAEVTDTERTSCKERTFLINYGGGAKRLAQSLGIPKKRAWNMIQEYFATFSGLKRFIDEVHRNVRRDLEVETVFGFRRAFSPPVNWVKPDGWHIQRQAYNTMIQGPAFHMVACGMIWLRNEMQRRKMRSKMILQVHDSVVVDAPPEEVTEMAEMLKYGMEIAAINVAKEYGVNFDLPLAASVVVGDNWGETEPWNGEKV
jgi:DNA polymerase-1